MLFGRRGVDHSLVSVLANQYPISLPGDIQKDLVKMAILNVMTAVGIGPDSDVGIRIG